MRCLASVAPIVGADCEVILVDNGSADGTSAEVAERFPQIKIIVSERNLGVAGGRNLGLRHCSGDYLMILDNDTVARPSMILRMAEFLEMNPEVGILAPMLVSPEGEVQRSYKEFPGILLKLRNLLFQRSDSVGVNEVKSSEPFYVIGAAQMFPRTVYERVGPFDENIFYGPEDADFCMAVRRSGLKVVYNPEFRIIHDWQRLTTSRPFSKMGRKHISALLYFYCKHNRWF